MIIHTCSPLIVKSSVINDGAGSIEAEDGGRRLGRGMAGGVVAAGKRKGSWSWRMFAADGTDKGLIRGDFLNEAEALMVNKTIKIKGEALMVNKTIKIKGDKAHPRQAKVGNMALEEIFHEGVIVPPPPHIRDDLSRSLP
ncbi:hypothetical protein ACFE04_021425 [Oxalis oulophora]